MNLEAIAEAIQRKKCILFLGAGVHYPPPEGSKYSYPAGDRPPLGGALSELLAKKCDLIAKHPKEANNTSNLQRVSWFFETLRSRQELVTAIRDAVDTNTQPSPILRALAELDFPLIITTNYDHLFERALTMAGKFPRLGVYDVNGLQPTADPPDIEDPKRPFVFKIHGDIDKPESIVVTDEDYIQFVLRMSDPQPLHPVPETFIFQFKKWPTLFVGYSLLDYNLRLLFKTLRWKVDTSRYPIAYSVDRNPDPLIFDTYENQRRFVRFIVEDIWSFVPDVYQKVTGKEMSL
jgi:hypothetical protein